MANPAADFGPIIEVEGRTHQEINDSVSSQGVDKLLGHIFNGMAAAFDPNAAGNESAPCVFASSMVGKFCVNAVLRFIRGVR